MASDADRPIGTTRQMRRRRSRLLPWIVLALATAGLCYAFPLVRFVRVEARAKQPPPPDVAAREFWDTRLAKSLDRAVDTQVLLAEIRSDAIAAKKKHSRRLGLGGSYYYFLGGTGRVVKKDTASIGVALGSGDQPDVVIETGPLFGNAVRDGTGLIDVNDYPNSQDFNRLSEELNKLVKTRVLISLRERAAVGSRVRFTGVAEVADEDTDLRPLRVVPVAAEVQQ